MSALFEWMQQHHIDSYSALPIDSRYPGLSDVDELQYVLANAVNLDGCKTSSGDLEILENEQAFKVRVSYADTSLADKIIYAKVMRERVWKDMCEKLEQVVMSSAAGTAA